VILLLPADAAPLIRFPSFPAQPYYPAATTSQTRRLLFAGVAAGQHKIVITLSGNKNTSSQGWYFYFDFLECAVKSDVPDPVATTTAVGVATDFDTDNTYKLSPQRLVRNIQKLRLLGEIDHYCGVFWWKQSVASSPSYPQCTVTFSGTWNDQDVVWLHVGGSAIGKTVFGGQDNSSTIARHFANFINAIFDGVWANAAGSVLTITSHSFGSVWQYHVYTELPASNTGSGQSTLGRALATFNTPNDDPSINSDATRTSCEPGSTTTSPQFRARSWRSVLRRSSSCCGRWT